MKYIVNAIVAILATFTMLAYAAEADLKAAKPAASAPAKATPAKKAASVPVPGKPASTPVEGPTVVKK
jgi:hypothetical protein